MHLLSLTLLLQEITAHVPDLPLRDLDQTTEGHMITVTRITTTTLNDLDQSTTEQPTPLTHTTHLLALMTIPLLTPTTLTVMMSTGAGLRMTCMLIDVLPTKHRLPAVKNPLGTMTTLLLNTTEPLPRTTTGLRLLTIEHPHLPTTTDLTMTELSQT